MGFAWNDCFESRFIRLFALVPSLLSYLDGLHGNVLEELERVLVEEGGGLAEGGVVEHRQHLPPVPSPRVVRRDALELLRRAVVDAVRGEAQQRVLVAVAREELEGGLLVQEAAVVLQEVVQLLL